MAADFVWVTAADRFRRALEEPSAPSRGVHPKMARVARQALAAQLRDLARQYLKNLTGGQATGHGV
jgi:hypothetical protein